jgi:glycosyltransferase involved in cell wall biosynthesis
LAAFAAKLAVPLELRGDLPPDELVAAYASADVFALLSTHEPWGVVVNEAAASALPLVLSDRVGAATDLLRDGENGFLVPADDAEAAAGALRTLLDPDERRRAGARSRELVHDWGYGPSVEAFVAAVREAAASR